MTDDSWDVEESMDFHPCDRPHGVKDYVLKDLTEDQQIKLNLRKTEQVRANHKYLADHPEIRGIIIMILRVLLKSRPPLNLHETVGRYFMRSSVDIKEEVFAYLDKRSEKMASPSFALPSQIEEDRLSFYSAMMDESVSTVSITKFESDISVNEPSRLLKDTEGEKEEVTSAKIICNEIMNKILDHVIIEAGDVFSIESYESLPEDYDDLNMRRSSSSSDETE